MTKGKKSVENKNRKKARTTTESTNMVDINPNISVITLNSSSLNKPIKRQIVTMDQKAGPNYMMSTRNLL